MRCLKVKVEQIGTWEHCSQIMAGFEMLREQGRLSLDASECRWVNSALVSVSVNGKRIVYDMTDGYQSMSGCLTELRDSYLYYKRSYSAVKNASIVRDFALVDKMRPLGLNYAVTLPGSLYRPHRPNGIIGFARKFFGWKDETYFTPEKFEGRPEPRDSDQLRILFMTRLWNLSDKITADERDLRMHNNSMRISIVRECRNRYGDRFFGGLNRTPLSCSMAPDCVIGYGATNRARYLRRLHCADICIASTGLYESIGWKTAEYVAAAKAIVSERLHYEVPGGFLKGRNYLEFESSEEAVAKIDELIQNPKLVLDMKMANKQYYQNWLRPDKLVWHSLEGVQ